MASPIEQFNVKPLYTVDPVAGFDISFTNASLFMVIAVGLIWIFYTLSMRKAALVPSRMQSMAELTYQFVDGIVVENAGHNAKSFFPYIFSLFIFVLFCNLLGMIPYSFTVTSHIVVTFALAALVFTAVVITGLIKQGPVKFFAHFAPAGLPIAILPVVFVIELVSFLARPISLSIRLAANMMAGHTLLKVIAGFVAYSSLTLIPHLLVGAASVAFLVVMTGFEVFIAILHAYIFTLLSCIYLGEVLHEEAH